MDFIDEEQRTATLVAAPFLRRSDQFTQFWQTPENGTEGNEFRARIARQQPS
jgi:hypothetical protein